MLRNGLILVVVSLTVALAVAPAQTPAGGGGNTGGVQPSGGNNNGGQPAGGNSSGSQQQQRQPQQPSMPMEPTLFLSGSVVMASGGAPIEPVRIDRVCGMQKTSMGYTDSKGRFSFAFMPSQEHGFQDASMGGPLKRGAWSSGGLGGVGVGACSLEAEAPGFRSNQVSLRFLDGRDVEPIILTPLGGKLESLISATSLAAPKKATASFFKAMKELGKGPSANLGKVMQELQKAVDEYPQYAAAWTRLGQVKADSGDPAGAIVALEKAVEADPRYVLPYDALVLLYMGKGECAHATELTQFVLGINPAAANMRWYQAVCDYDAGRDDEALALLGEILRDPEGAAPFPKIHQIMGLIYAKRGELGEAAAAYNRYLELDPNAPAAEAIKKQLSEWQQLGVL